MASEQQKYTYLSWEIDTTGHYILDEMCRLSAFMKQKSFDEYIMPHNNISYAIRKKIQLDTVTLGVYRVLKDTSNGKILKTNSEIGALKKFLNWLKELKVEKRPVVLMCYEPHEYSPLILLQALKRYDLLEEFKTIVHGFANIYSYIKSKCKKSVSSMSVKTLAKILLNKNDLKCLDSNCRVKLTHEILTHLSEDTDYPERIVTEEMVHYISTVDQVDDKLINKLLKKSQLDSLKPIFYPHMSEFQRKRTLALRNLLTYQSSLDYDTLKNLWNMGSEALKNEISEQTSAPAKDIDDIAKMVLLHFENINMSDMSNLESSVTTLKLQ